MLFTQILCRKSLAVYPIHRDGTNVKSNRNCTKAQVAAGLHQYLNESLCAKWHHILCKYVLRCLHNKCVFDAVWHMVQCKQAQASTDLASTSCDNILEQPREAGSEKKKKNSLWCIVGCLFLSDRARFFYPWRAFSSCLKMVCLSLA